MITVKADQFRSKKAPLYCRYPQQTSPQLAYIEMTESGAVSAYYSGEIGTAVTFDVYHARTLTWSITPDVAGDALADFLARDDVLALLNRVHAGHEVKWDGNNHVGYLTDDAKEASDELDLLIQHDINDDETERAIVWDVDEWLFSGCSLREHWSECSLVDAVADLKSCADSENVYLDGDLEEALLDQAKYLFYSSPEKLELVHVQALLDEDEIDGSEFESWKEEQNS